ncbi:MAG TPA: F0F1 ATP synthase subunit delta [Candidatus Dojkabacteria bacterium]|jgi:F0F1-type ATP synthase delta subunit
MNKKETIEIITAHENLDPSIIELVKKKFGSDAEIRIVYDKSIIGGISVRKSDELFDGTIKNQLEKLRVNLYKIK